MVSVVRASQAISGAPDLERLLKTPLRIANQHVGAQRGVVIIETSGALRVVAEGSSDTQEVPNPRAERDELPAKLAVISDIAKNSIETIRTFMNLAAEMILSPLMAFNLHLIFKEAMTNMRKHAAVALVVLTIDSTGEGLTISLRDDGRGFDMNAILTGGHGIVNMAARAEKLGATFSTSSEPRWGTLTRLFLPTA